VREQQLHEAIAGQANGGVGPGLSPEAALAVGLKVDSDRLGSLADDLKAGKVDLKNPASTLALLEADAVVGVKGVFDDRGKLASVGIRCSLCHSTVDDSLAPGIGRRRDGWPNRDLNVGEIIALAPNLAPVATVLGLPDPAGQGTQDAVRTVVRAWGPGKFDAELLLDGKVDGKPTLLPAAFGLAGVNMHTHFYQLALKPPKPPAGSFDATAAASGKQLFEGKARCAECHVPPLFTEPGWNVHTAAEIGIDDAQAQRSPDAMYRTTPLSGLFTRTKGGFFHDGRFATLADVVSHYDTAFGLGLSADEKAKLVEYLKSL
jgi:hypothetical protein